MITEREAVTLVMGLGSAFINNDKETREMLYADLDEESLKRALRWAVRGYVTMTAILASASGTNIQEAWTQIAQETALAYELKGE